MSETVEVETALSTEAASGAAPQPPAPVEPAAESAAEAKPALRAAVVCGPASKLPTGYDLVIVAEGRSYQDATLDDAGEVLAPAASAAARSGYPKGAALYFRTDPEVTFPEGAPVLTLGVDVLQWKFGGFVDHHPNVVNVGPCHPAYAAANLAYQRGATAIDILGLAEGEKERLQPWFDGVPTHAVEPAQVAVSIL